MKIYFTASTTTHNPSVYQRMIKILHKQGHDVFEKILSEYLPSPKNISGHNVAQWYKEWSSYISDCDFALVEGSYPSSIHIGFEVGMILARNKPVVLLHEHGKDPVFMNSYYSPRLIKSEYTEDSLEEVLAWCFEEIAHLINRRFTFFVSPDIDAFLDTVSQKTGVSRAEYIRELIEKERRQTKD